MAKTILDKVSLDLSYKLQDPATAGSSSGVRLTAAERLGYIFRGYRRLMRLVTLLHPELLSLLFKRYFITTTITTNDSGILTLEALPRTEVFSIYARQPSEETYKKVRYVAIGLGLDTEMGENEFYTPNLNTGQLYWYQESDNIHILPAVKYDIKLLYRPDILAIVESEGYSGTTDLDIPSDCIDILLSAACAEAYMDLGELQLVESYKKDLSEQLMILASTQQQKEKKDELF